MAIYDVEQFLKEAGVLFKAQLNTEINAINIEKGDFNINTINANAWYLNYIPGVFSYPEFIVWGLDSVSPTESQNDNFIKTPKIAFEVILIDKGEKTTEQMIYKHLRYMRALESVANKNYDKFHGIAKLQVQDLLPTSFVWSGKILRSAGISITASFTAN